MYESSNHAQQGNNHIPVNNSLPNGNPNGHHQRSVPPTISKDPISVVGIPSVSIQNNRLIVGNSQSSSSRSYTPLKVLGDGSFGTVWLCDWHGTLPPNTPLSPMQCGGGAKPEWAGKRLVAVKRMKKRWEGGWDECKKLKELESLRAIPFHPNIIPLYDFFLLPASKELYFVFESMEGNLYHLIRARKGRALAGGLVSSIFRQVVSGLHHIHASGYFHRDMKPENVLVTTTGLFDYQPVSPVAPPNAPPEKDVVAIIKLADFGLARETKSKPPYTEYVSTRWYRAPEVLLLSKDYSNPVDMWALGTIMAELVNLRPLFPGSGQVDQIARICEVLGDPNDDYGTDARGKSVGGGRWPKGVKMAKAVGFGFPKIQPRNIHALFDKTVPTKLVECISDLLKYDPDARLTSRQCLEHPYLLETTPRNNVPLPTGLSVQTSTPSKRHQPNGLSPSGALPISSPRSLPPSHSHSPHSMPKSLLQAYVSDVSTSHRSHYYPTPDPSTATSHTPSSHRTAEFVNELRIYEQTAHVDMIQEEQRSQAVASSVWGSDRDGPSSPVTQSGWPMDLSPQHEVPPYDLNSPQPMDIMSSPMAQEDPSRLPTEPEPHAINGHGGKPGKRGVLGFPKKPSKWDIGRMFGHADKGHLPPLHEVPPIASGSTPPLHRAQSSSGDSRSLSELSPGDAPRATQKDPRKVKKEAERVQHEAEKQRRALAEKMHREQARAVMQKRNQMLMQTADDLEWKWHHVGSLLGSNPGQRSDPGKGKEAASGPIRQGQGSVSGTFGSPTISAAAGRFSSQESSTLADWRRDVERYPKARRREFDDDHSMSSSDVHSIGPLSNISFATVDSDPGPGRMRHPPNLFGINRVMTSTSSLRTSFDDFPASVRSSNSLSFEQQFANEFRSRATVDPALSGSVSPPPMQTLSLSSSPPWMQQPHLNGKGHTSLSPRPQAPPSFIPISPSLTPNPSNLKPNGPHSPFEFNSSASSLHGFPPSPGVAPKSAINPIFKVPPLPSPSPSQALPPFSQLEAVAEGEYPPLSPMSFHTPED